MARQCGDCLYFVTKDDYCNKHKKTISGCEYPDEHHACSYFRSDQSDSCRQCQYLTSLSFCKKKCSLISHPSYYRCDSFVYDY